MPRGKSPAVTILRIAKLAKDNAASILAVEQKKTHTVITFADGERLHLTGWYEKRPNEAEQENDARER